MHIICLIKFKEFLIKFKLKNKYFFKNLKTIINHLIIDYLIISFNYNNYIILFKLKYIVGY
jgi:hypothetical protein